MKPDLFQSPDYYNLDDLLTDEHKLVRDSARAWVKREVHKKNMLKKQNSKTNS
jgi:glutaryl-CoA dehydrogenase